MSTRDELTRQADKALRQGRPDQAIELYQQLAVLVPIDWNQVKQLADLLERGSQREAAAEQFLRYADYLFTEGFHSRAAALYKKVLKLEPAHERALWQLGEVSLELKLRADARQAFQRVLDQRLRQHDEAGVAEVRRRLAALDPTVSPASAPDPPPPSDPIAPAAPTPASLESAHPDPAGTSPGDVTAEAPTPPESVDAHLAR
ncbi:MAG: tetratricopeptide repeat protein, partial [Acidobacteria bacterium]|nr:tetratricopeptide repeat protein [Acidobacteriota bacterium]